MTKSFRENYDNICEEYTTLQLDFYNNYPDVTRFFVYRIFSKICDSMLSKTSEGDFVVLDPCCGFGKDTAFFESYLKINHPGIHAQVISGDSSGGMLEIAKATFDVEQPMHRPYEDMDLGDESIDLIATRYGLDYPINPSELFQELNRVLKPSGYVIGIINHFSLMEQLPCTYSKDGLDFLKLPAFHGNLELLKPRLDWRAYFRSMTDSGFDVLFNYAGKEHPMKFPLPTKNENTHDYLAFVLKKSSNRPSQNKLVSIENSLVPFIQGIQTLEDLFTKQSDSGFDGFVGKSQVLTPDEFNMIARNIIDRGGQSET